MTRRWLLIIGGVLVLGLLIAWVGRNVYWEEVEIPTPLRGEARTNRFYAAQRLIAELGGRSERRHALGEAPATDAVLVLTYWHWTLLESRRVQLERWVEAGGRLVLDGTLIGGENGLAEWSGVARELPPPPDADAEQAAGESGHEAEPHITETPNGEADSENCWTLEASHGSSALTPANGFYTICGLAQEGWLTSVDEPQWALSDGENWQAIRVAVGRGSVTRLNAEPFGNRALLERDHARLFVDAAQLKRGDLVVFVSEEEHASLLALIWRYGAPVVLLVLALIAAALWRGAVRFGPMEGAPPLSRRSLAEQIRGTGQFILRAGRGKALHAAMVRAVHEAAARRIPHYARLQPQQRIDAIAALTGADADRLASTINYIGARRPHDLRRDVALLDSLRTTIMR